MSIDRSPKAHEAFEFHSVGWIAIKSSEFQSLGSGKPLSVFQWCGVLCFSMLTLFNVWVKFNTTVKTVNSNELEWNLDYTEIPTKFSSSKRDSVTLSEYALDWNQFKQNRIPTNLSRNGIKWIQVRDETESNSQFQLTQTELISARAKLISILWPNKILIGFCLEIADKNSRWNIQVRFVLQRGKHMFSSRHSLLQRDSNSLSIWLRSEMIVSIDCP